MTALRSLRRHDAESGFTLVELLITVLLLGVVMGIIFNFLDTASAITNRSANNLEAERDGQLALRRITQEVRAAKNLRPCTTGTYADCLQFDVVRPSTATPNCVTTYSYRVSGSLVSQDLADAGCSTNRTWTNRKVVDGTSAKLFTYFDRLGRTIDVTSTCSADLNQPVCVPYARSVKVSLVIPFQGRPPGSLALSSTATLRNNR